jgi:tRNA A-37 threonylcarbamoyl transferase component Bud32
VRLQLTARTGHPDFLDLPWGVPLADWVSERLVEMPLGIHRHVVRTVRYEDRLYHLKELPRRYALREWRFLRHLKDEGVPVVDVVGVVTHRETASGDRLEACLITEHLEYSVPYRLLFLRSEHRSLREPLIDAMAQLLVRIHLNGFYWGDCSLSNTLFRRDAGSLAAYLVDTETGELHDELSPGQRAADVDLAIEKAAGEVLDLQAAGVVPDDLDPFELVEELGHRYEELWAALTGDEVFAADERYRIHERLGRINEIGYDVEELELVQDADGSTRMRLRTSVLEPGRYRRLLRERTGLEAQDNQARALLNDVANFGAWIQQQEGRTIPDALVAHRWLERSFEPTVALVPAELRGRLQPAEVFIEVLDHWHRWSAESGADLDLLDAARRYVDEVLVRLPDERRIAADDLAQDHDLVGYLPDSLADTGVLDLRAVREAAGGDGAGRPEWRGSD